MYKHSNSDESQKVPSVEEKMGKESPADVREASKQTSQDMRDLLEKNLKWSQIIYEQNRKINRKLAWSAAASWMHFLIVAVPIILAILFLLPYYKNVANVYNQFSNFTQKGTAPQSTSELLRLLPLNDFQKEQLKQILK